MKTCLRDIDQLQRVVCIWILIQTTYDNRVLRPKET